MNVTTKKYTAEVANFLREELRSYEESLKYYRDLKNSLDTAFEEGKKEGKNEVKKEGRMEAKTEVILNGVEVGLAVATLAKLTGLTIQEVERIIKENTK